MKNAIVLCLISLLLSSCIGIEQKLTMRGNGSSQLSFVYTIARETADLALMAGDGQTLAIPVNKPDFQALVRDRKDSRLLSWDRKELDKNIIISAVLEFDSPEALVNFDLSGETPFAIRKEGAATILEDQIPIAGLQDLSADSIAMMTELCAGYDLIFTIVTPAKIIEQNGGILSDDQRSVTLKTSVSDIMQSRDKRKLTVKW